VSDKVKVLIVDDHAILREGVRALLKLHDDLEVVGEASNGQQALEEEARLGPDVILMDISMPGLGGIEATLELKKRGSRARILILSQYEDREYVRRLLKAGVSGFVLKKSAGAELANAIRAVRRAEGAGRRRSVRHAHRSREAGPEDRRGGAEQQGGRGASRHQREDRDDAPRARDGEAGGSQPDGARPLRDQARRHPGRRVGRCAARGAARIWGTRAGGFRAGWGQRPHRPPDAHRRERVEPTGFAGGFRAAVTSATKARRLLSVSGERLVAGILGERASDRFINPGRRGVGGPAAPRNLFQGAENENGRRSPAGRPARVCHFS
jgi:DNA-binding NarL/FixJ family response regulator